MTCCEGGGDYANIPMIGANRIDNELACEDVALKVLLGVGVLMRQLGATVEGITDVVWDRAQVLDG
jgi:hypothetical protein